MPFIFREKVGRKMVEHCVVVFVRISVTSCQDGVVCTHTFVAMQHFFNFIYELCIYQSYFKVFTGKYLPNIYINLIDKLNNIDPNKDDRP